MPPAPKVSFVGHLPETGKKYWFYHPKVSWILGTCLRIEDENKGLIRMKPDEMYANDDPVPEEITIVCDDDNLHFFQEEDIQGDYDNLLDMTELHEGPLLHLVKKRFKKDLIYVCFSFILYLIFDKKKSKNQKSQKKKLDLYWTTHSFSKSIQMDNSMGPK